MKFRPTLSSLAIYSWAWPWTSSHPIFHTQVLKLCNCRGLNENVTCRLMSLVGGNIGKGLGGVALLEGVCRWRQALRAWSLKSFPALSLLHLAVWDVSSCHDACCLLPYFLIIHGFILLELQAQIHLSMVVLVMIFCHSNRKIMNTLTTLGFRW